MMDFKKPSIDEVVKLGVKYGVELMGDDFIGFKFIGENSSFWNGIIMDLYENGVEVSEVLNSKWLKENGVAYSEYSSERWAS